MRGGLVSREMLSAGGAIEVAGVLNECSGFAPGAKIAVCHGVLLELEGDNVLDSESAGSVGVGCHVLLCNVNPLA